MKLLLDVHVAKAVLGALRKTAPAVQAQHLSQWRHGALLQADDETILAACHTEKQMLLTYDLATIPDLLRRWMAEDRPHSGVIFADEHTLKPNAPAALAAAIADLAREIGSRDTTNLIHHLHPRH